MPGAMYAIQVTNAKVVRQGLQNFAKGTILVGRKGLYNFALRVKKRLRYTKANPSKRGKYVRTFTLLHSYMIESVEDGYVFSADPVGPKGQRYGAYVLGTMLPKSQHWAFQGRWPAIRDVVLEEGAKLPAEVQEALGILAMREAK